MIDFYETGCVCPDVPCPYHPTPLRPFNKLAEDVALDFFKAAQKHDVVEDHQ